MLDLRARRSRELRGEIRINGSTLEATVPADQLPPPKPGTKWRAGAVVEELSQDGSFVQSEAIVDRTEFARLKASR